MDTEFSQTDNDNKVEIRRTGSDVTWIFKNIHNQPVEFDMSFIRATTVTALLKRSLNEGQQTRPRVLHGTMTELHVFPEHTAIVFDQNPNLCLVRSREQMPELIRNLEQAA